MCLIYKKWVKKWSKIQILKNEIHRVDSPSDEDSKNILLFASEALISGEERLEMFGKMTKNREIYCYCYVCVVNFNREY